MRTECEDDKGWQFRSAVPGRRVRERGPEGGARPVRPRWAEGGRGPGQPGGGGGKWRNVRPRTAGNERWTGCGTRYGRVNGAVRRIPSARQRVPNSAKPVNCVAGGEFRTNFDTNEVRLVAPGGDGRWGAVRDSLSSSGPPALPLSGPPISGPARWTARAPGWACPFPGVRVHRRAMRRPPAVARSSVRSPRPYRRYAGPGTGRRAGRRGRKGRRGWWGTAWRLAE